MRALHTRNFNILTFADSDSDLHPLLKLLRLLSKRIFKSFVTLNIATIEIGPFFSHFSRTRGLIKFDDGILFSSK